MRIFGWLLMLVLALAVPSWGGRVAGGGGEKDR